MPSRSQAGAEREVGLTSCRDTSKHGPLRASVRMGQLCCHEAGCQRWSLKEGGASITFSTRVMVINLKASNYSVLKWPVHDAEGGALRETACPRGGDNTPSKPQF